MTPRPAYDLVVVGAGPAGMAAAAEAAGRVSVLVVDDNPAAGGQVWRGAGAGPLADGRVLGRDYAGGSWKQDGDQLYFEVNNRYAEYTLTFQDGQFAGDAKNVKGNTWTLTLTRPEEKK